MFSMKKSVATSSNNINVKIDKNAKLKQDYQSYTQKVFNSFGSNIKPHEQLGIADTKLFKNFKKIYKTFLALGLIYTLNSQYQMDNLVSLNSVVAICFSIFSLQMINLIGFFKLFMLKIDKSLVFAFSSILLMSLIAFSPSQSDMTAEILARTFNHSSILNQTTIVLLNENTKLNPKNADINQEIIDKIKKENMDTLPLLNKKHDLTHYHYTLSTDYQNEYNKYYPKIADTLK